MFLFTLFFVPFRLFQMFHLALFLFISGHSGCSTLHYACSFQVIPDVPLCIIFVHFRLFWMFRFVFVCVCSFQVIPDVPLCIIFVHFRSFQIFHFALFLLISGHSGCSTLHVGHTRIQQTTQWMSSFWILCPWVALISWMGTKCMWSSSQRRRRILLLDLLNWTFKVLTCPYTLFLYFL